MPSSGFGRERSSLHQPPSVVDVLDRVLEKGVVVIATVGVSVVGLRLIDLDARVVVSSIDTYLSRVETIEAVAHARPLSAGPAAVPASTRPRGMRRRRQAARWRPIPVADVIRCRDGCTFERDTITLANGRFRCPYRRGVRCQLEAA